MKEFGALRFRFKGNKIAWKLITYLFCFSILVFCITAGVQLRFEHIRNIRAIEKKFEDIKTGYIPSLSAALWSMDREYLRIQLEAVVNLSDIEYAAVLKTESGGGLNVSAGSPPASNKTIERVFTLTYRPDGNNRDYMLGTFQVAAGMEDVYQRLKDGFRVIAVSQGIIVFSVFILFFFLFYVIVGRPLHSIVQFVETVDIGSFKDPLILNKNRARHKPGDELEQLADAINRMCSDLKHSYTALSHLNSRLKQTTYRYGLLARNIPDSDLFLLDRDLRFLAAEGMEMKRYGLMAESLEGRRFDEVVDAKRRKILEPSLQNALSGRPAENEFNCRDGHYLIRLIPIRNGGGEVEGVMAIVRNISERKKAENNLQRTRERFQEILDCATSVIYVKDREGRYTFVNRHFTKLSGYRPEDVLGKTDFELFPPEVARNSTAHDIEVFKSGTALETEEFGPVEGSMHTFVSAKFPLLSGSSGRINEICGISTDIDDRKRMEQQLSDTKAMLEAAFEQTPIPMVMASAEDGKIMIVNTACKEFLGIEDEPDPVGMDLFSYHQSWADFNEDGEPVTLRELPLARALEGEVTRNKLYCIVRKDGEKRWELVSGAPVYNRDCALIAGFAVFPDITRLKKTEETIKRLNRRLTNKNKELEQIVYAASHDLRSPLVNIQGFSRELDYTFTDIFDTVSKSDDMETVREKMNKLFKRDVKQSLDFIFRSAAKMDLLLSGLLRISRLGGAKPSIKLVHMNSMISDIVKTFKYRIKQAGAFVTHDDLPDCDADESMLNQVFSNLIDNALKFLPPDKPGVIKISGVKESGHVEYCVEDNGPGISEMEQGRIFELFHRLDPEIEGEGLGLTIIRKIIEKHYGTVRVESEPGVGSRFYVSVGKNVSGDAF